MALRTDISRLTSSVERLRHTVLRNAEAEALAGDRALLMDRAGLPADPWQADLLRGDWERALLLCSRQAGKSTTTACLATHTALYEPGALVLLLSPSLRQSQELFRKVVQFYVALDHPTPADAVSSLRLELANGSRIVALPGSERTIRGFSGVDLLVVDEASRVDDELFYSIRPMLAVSNGRLLCLTTPFGKRGFFYEAWIGTNAWKRVKITAHDVPRITAAFLEEERRTIGEWWFRQEYLCEFSDTIDSAFRSEDIERAFTPEVKPLFAPAAADDSAPGECADALLPDPDGASTEPLFTS